MNSIIRSTKIRAGMYEVLLSNGKCYCIESHDPAWWDGVKSDFVWRIIPRDWLDLGNGFKWYNADGGSIRDMNTKAECMAWVQVYG